MSSRCERRGILSALRLLCEHFMPLMQPFHIFLELLLVRPPRARACCACDFGWCSCQEPLQTGWPAGGVPCRHRQTAVTGALSNCGRFAVARTERTAKRLACWLSRPPAEQPARHVRWPTCPSLRYEQRVGLLRAQAGDKLLCFRPQKTAKPSKGACPRRKPRRTKRPFFG